MVTRQEHFFRDVVALLDVATLIAAFLVSYLIRDAALGPWHGTMPPISTQAWILGVILPTWMVLLRRASLHQSASVGSPQRFLRALLGTQVLGGLVLFSALLLTRSWDVSRLFLLVFLVVSGIALYLARVAIRFAMQAPNDWHGLGLRRVVIVPNLEQATDRLLERLASQPLWKIEVVGFLYLDAAPPKHRNGRRILGAVADAERVLREEIVDEVIATAPSPGEDELRRLAGICLERGITYRTFFDLPPSLSVHPFVEALDKHSYLLSFETFTQEPYSLILKRLLDVAGALVGLVAVGIVHLWYYPRLRRESPGSIYFRQVRVGQNGRPFVLYKFRTMYPDAERRLDEILAQNEMKGSIFKMRDDPRLLPSGKALRRRYLDELPQFWNVLRGEMSLVGTRPPTPNEVAEYRTHHYRRLNMKPGITGLWQLEGNGRVSDFEHVVKLDARYIDDWSFVVDCKILWKTLRKVARADGW